MARSTDEKIILKGDPIIKEAQCSAAVKPGHFLALAGKKVKPWATAKVAMRKSIALENDLIGKGINDGYAKGERVITASLHSGQEVLVRIAAGAAAITAGDGLEAKGDGTVRKKTNGVVIGYALSAIDNSAGTTEDFVQMEVV